MRITDRSPTGRRLQTIFFPQEPGPVIPSEVSDEIVLIHPALPPMVGFKESKFFHSITVGADGATSVAGPLVPTDRYWWVQFCELRHDDVTLRRLGMLLRDTVPNDAYMRYDPVTRVPNEPLVVNRPFLLPNDTQIVGTANALAATFFLTLRFFYLEFLHAEINPTA